MGRRTLSKHEDNFYMWILIKHVNIVSGVKKVCHPKTCRWANTESFSCGDGQNRRTEQNRTPHYYSAGVSQFTSGAKKAHFLWLGVVQNTRIITGSALAPFSMRVYFRASRVPCTVGSVHVRQLLARDPGTWSTHTHTHTPTPAKHLCCCWVSALTKQWADANLLKLTTHTHTHTVHLLPLYPSLHVFSSWRFVSSACQRSWRSVDLFL